LFSISKTFVPPALSSVTPHDQFVPLHAGELKQDYPDALLRLPVHRSCSGIIEAGLWECNIGWSPVVPATPVAVGDECSSTISVQCESV